MELYNKIEATLPFADTILFSTKETKTFSQGSRRNYGK